MAIRGPNRNRGWVAHPYEVCSILDSCKTQFRRIVKPQCEVEDFGIKEMIQSKCPYGGPGSRLWVKETFWQCLYGPTSFTSRGIRYPATDKDPGWPKRYASQMLQPMSRISMTVAEIRIERVQDISADDAEAEGVHVIGCALPRGGSIRIEAFARSWDAVWTARRYGWEHNPFVWVVLFDQIEVVRP